MTDAPKAPAAPAGAPGVLMLDAEALYLELKKGVQRLLTAADVQARELLATRGLFAPLLDWQTAAGADTGPRWQVRLQVHPGPVAHIQEVRWHFLGHIQNSDAHAAQREALQQQWLLPAGKAFSQDAWNEAKAASLRLLTAEHYPLGRWVHTQAHVDAQQHSVVLELTADSGPEVFFGPTTISGQERYSRIPDESFVSRHLCRNCVCRWWFQPCCGWYRRSLIF